MAKLLRLHVVHMSNGQAVQGLADVLDVIALYVPHHHDLRFGLQSGHTLCKHTNYNVAEYHCQQTLWNYLCCRERELLRTAKKSC